MIFKVGDVVRVAKISKLANSSLLSCVGKVGEIAEIKDSGDFRIRIDFSDNDRLNNNNLFENCELESVRVKDTKIARKLNRDNIEKIEEGWLYLK